MSAELTRCAWTPLADPLYVRYHDEEWGTPSRDDRHLFELLVLEGAQAGLSWATILRKREGYRRGVRRVRGRSGRRVRRRRSSTGSWPTRASSATGPRSRRRSPTPGRCSRVRDELGSLVAHLWRSSGGEPIVNRWRTMAEIPAETDESRAMSRDLKGRGFGSSGRRSATRSCSRPAWSTTTRSTASAGRRSRPADRPLTVGPSAHRRLADRSAPGVAQLHPAAASGAPRPSRPGRRTRTAPRSRRPSGRPTGRPPTARSRRAPPAAARPSVRRREERARSGRRARSDPRGRRGATAR